MARDIQYRQCKLERSLSGGGRVTKVSWIPERKGSFVIAPGVKITLKDYGSSEELEGVWTVMSVSEESVSSKVAHERAHKWKHYRSATDI